MNYWGAELKTSTRIIICLGIVAIVIFGAVVSVMVFWANLQQNRITGGTEESSANPEIETIEPTSESTTPEPTAEPTLEPTTEPETPTEPSSITKPLSELLPTRQDISTEWVIGSLENETTIIATGFMDGVAQGFTKSGLDVTRTTIQVYRFDTSDNAKDYYDDIVGNVLSEGGYTEVSTKSLGTTSYGTFNEYLSGEITVIYSLKLNIYTTVKVSSPFSLSTQEDALQFAKIVMDKL